MDTSGNNRYELLFMEDDGSTPPTEASSAKTELKKKQPKVKIVGVPPTGTKKQQSGKKATFEKENKSLASNKDDIAKKNDGGGNGPLQSKQASAVAVTKKSRSDGSDICGRSVSFREQKYDNREQRLGRNNYREGSFNNAGVDYNNHQERPARQFRDRDNRGALRNRSGEVAYRSGKREFDRQSGSDKTGVKAVDKRDGAGAHNWGSAKQDIEDIDKSDADIDAAFTDKEELGNDQSMEQVPVPEEEESKVLTLDEWKALRQTRNKPQFNIRKAGEGEDTSQWKKMVALNKKKDGDSEEELEYDPSLYPQRVGRLQRIVDIKFNFNDGRRGGFGGYGRGRGRGSSRGFDRPRFDDGRSVGSLGDAPDRSNVGKAKKLGDKTTRGKQNLLKVDDERQFPTLS